KLRLEWSSREFGGLLTPSKLAEARASFPHLETPIKVRLLLSLLSVRDASAAQEESDALLQLAEKDAEEWVKVSAGLVKQFLVLQADGQAADSYLHMQLEATASKVVQTAAGSSPQRHSPLDDFFSLENGLLNPSLRPQVAPTAATHFTVSGEDDDANGKEDDVGVSPVKKPLHRPQMARPSGMAASAAATASARLTQIAKPPVGKKKNLTELSSEIRRKADAGRFKRQRSRISMIDINEVKQIESEKAQKAEERKKQKLAAKEKEKEKAKEKEKEKSDAAANVAVNSGESGAVDTIAAPVVVNDEHAAIAADIFAMHQQPGPDESMQYSQQPQLQTEDTAETTDLSQASGDDYVPDGTQALLNAAFHSTQDIMKEVVSQQNQQLQEQQQIQQQQQQMQMHHLAPPQQYHQGFEPEDATLNTTNATGVPMGFGGYNYGSTAGYYGDQFGNYGAPQDTNAFGSTGYSHAALGQQDNGLGLPPLGGRQLGFDPTPPQQQQHPQQNNGGYMGGSGEYWR
ncbi:Negative elongation factor A, partial [Phytophthora megakarya]